MTQLTPSFKLIRPEGQEAGDLDMSRRGLGGAFFFGFTLAAGAVNAAALTTSEEGLFTKNLMIPTLVPQESYAIPAFVSMPITKGAHPVVIVVSEIFGLHDYIRDVCRRLSHQGYVAIALDFFARKGNLAAMTDFKQIMPMVQATPYTQVLDDLKAAIKWLGEGVDFGQPKGSKPNLKRLGVTGFCWGGAVTWMAASTLPEVKAGVAWYGRLEASAQSSTTPAEVRPWPLDIANSLTKPVLGLYADKDRGISIDSVNRMNAALSASGKTKSHIKLFSGAEHGFHADYRASYNEAAAKEGWADLLAWFKANL